MQAWAGEAVRNNRRRTPNDEAADCEIVQRKVGRVLAPRGPGPIDPLGRKQLRMQAAVQP